MEFKRPETLTATGKSVKRICRELGRSGIDGRINLQCKRSYENA